MAFLAVLVGSLLGSYLILRFLMYGIMKVRRQANGATEIAFAGFLVLVIATIGGGYGMQDELPEPQFIAAFYSYFGPSMLVTVIELVRLDRRKSR
ncbi:MAG: hypothetical protein F4213_16515 [Boseongicola sp. SB0677_bin_26]|nr:hypothetical protein [Boseongicola sp. SB0665_bin_10]MYG27595.1 hypothetical protein [Boseongicola sp. SB0677_bin_26]